MRVIVAGSRSFSDYHRMTVTLDKALSDDPSPTIISGTARGADRLGELYARDRDLPLERYPADWGRYGRPAGFIRNQEMANCADALALFWDGKSKGSAHMLRIAKERGLVILDTGMYCRSLT